MKTTQSITGLSFASSLLTSTVLLIIVGGLWFQSDKRVMEEEYATFKADYINAQKATIRNEVDKLIDFATYSKSHTEERIRHEIKGRVDEAYTIALHLYSRYKDTKNTDEIKKMVREALRPLRFNDGRGYYFATRLDGVEELFPDRPELEGKNLMDMRDTEGKWVIKDMAKIAQTDGQGYYTYSWIKPGMGSQSFQKIAYIKYFAPFDWFIGTGEYYDDMETIIKQEVLDRIGQIRFGKNGYIFAFQTDGIYLSHIDKEYIGKQLLDISDSKGFKVNRKLVQIVKENNSGFLEYTWMKPSSRQEEPKLAYVRGFDDWQWIIGSGIYLTDLDISLQAAKARLDKRITKELRTLLMLFAGLLLASLLLSFSQSKRIAKGIETFDNFFAKAASSHEKIDESGLTFKEFKVLATRANIMVDDMANAKRDLANLNQHLEEQVLQRTAELEAANKKLVKLDEVKSNFISTVSHELRTPMTSIIGFTKLIGRDLTRHFCPLGEHDANIDAKCQRILKNLDIIENEGERLTRLINDILDLSKIDSGNMEWRSENVTIEECVTMAVDSISGQLASKTGITLEKNIAPNIPLFTCDRDRLAQVIINLAGNALKFMDQGTIIIDASCTDTGDIQVLVKDNGPGISEEDCAVIFEKFRQAAHVSDNTKPQGTGLGLAISKQIVEHFGGTLWVKSAKGTGSTFGFTIPRNA